jgi:two-component system chemotaxis response regulator CheY
MAGTAGRDSDRAGTRVLSVGQCGFDQAQIERWLARDLGVRTISVDTLDEALDELRRGGIALVLVNRILDFDGSSGAELIREIKTEPQFANLPVMLVSNFESAQREAVALGALPGFGKAQVGQKSVAEQMRKVLISMELANEPKLT